MIYINEGRGGVCIWIFGFRFFFVMARVKGCNNVRLALSTVDADGVFPSSFFYLLGYVWIVGTIKSGLA